MIAKQQWLGPIGVFLLTCVLAAGASAAPKAPKARPKRTPPVKKVELTTAAAAKEAAAKVAHIRLAGEVLSAPPELSLFGQGAAMTLRDWLLRLGKARNDESVTAVALEIDSPAMSWAQAQELADAVRRLDEAKPVYAQLGDADASDYLVASAARHVTMDPSGTLGLVGLGGEAMFFRGTLDWIGVTPQMIQIGRFKGAAEPFCRTAPSPELKAEFDKIFDDLYDQLCGQIARQRHLTAEQTRKAIDEGPLSAEAAARGRLVDGLVAAADWRAHVSTAAGRDHRGPAIWLADYGRKEQEAVDLSNPFALMRLVLAGPPKEEAKDPTIAIIHAEGMIVPGSSGEALLGQRLAGARTLVKCFEEAAAEPRVKAVIFRVNSPGGSASASERIYQAVAACARKKPVIASIAQVGGSGGYYVAVGAPKVLADPAALTGSIGVISGKLAIRGLLEKLKISTYEIARGRNAGLGASREWTAPEEAAMRKLAERTYEQFVTRVKAGRGKRIKDLDAVAQGRVFTARQAAGNGLIDAVGGLREALAAAQQEAKITSSYILVLPRPKTLADLLHGGGDDTAMPPVPAGGRSGLELLGAAVGQDGLSAAAAVDLLRAASRGQRRSARLAGAAYLLNLACLLGGESALTAMPNWIAIQP